MSTIVKYVLIQAGEICVSVLPLSHRMTLLSHLTSATSFLICKMGCRRTKEDNEYRVSGIQQQQNNYYSYFKEILSSSNKTKDFYYPPPTEAWMREEAFTQDIL